MSTAPGRAPGATHAGAGGASRPFGRQVVVLVAAVVAHPSLWWAGLAAVARIARTRWWRRHPFLPLPGASYWHFRLVTAYGAEGPASAITGNDVVAYLRWCQRTRPHRG